MIADKYILVDDKPVPEPDLFIWGAWMEANHSNRHVEDTKIGEIRISTVFLGLDHSFDEGPPILYETLVFGGALDGEMDRYATHIEAVDGHQHTVDRVKNSKGARR